MPPHCDTMDGPVVTAARKALEENNVELILPWAPKDAEGQIREAFEKAIAARKCKEAREVADLWFFEQVVRLHRQGEGAPYTGLKPAGLPTGPVLPLAEETLETGSPRKLVDFFSKLIAAEITKRLDCALETQKHAEESVDAARENVEAKLDLELWSHHLYTYIEKGEGGHDGHPQGEK